MRQHTMVSGTLVLAVAAIVNRIVGLAFRAYLVRTFGQEAIGLYQMAFPLYVSVMTVSTAGISIGVARLVASHRQRGDAGGVRSALWAGSRLAWLAGSLGMLLLAAGSRTLAVSFVGEARLWVPLLAMAPALLIVSLGGAVRGYYQGMRYMSLIATGLLVEQAAHVVASLYLAFYLSPLGAGGISLGLAMGYTLGELCGLLTLLLLLAIARRPVTPTPRAGFAPLLAIVIPVGLGRLILSLTGALQAVLIPRSLRHMGYSASAAAIAYGQLTGMAVTVLFIPSVLTFPLASNLLPAMAESGDQPDKRYGLQSFLRGLTLALLLGWPSSVVFIAAGVDICLLLFGVAEAGHLLSSMGWVAWMIYLTHITTATLQGLGRPAVPTRNAAICTILSSLAIVLGTYLRPELGIYTAVIGVVTGIGTGAALGLLEVFKMLSGLRAVINLLLRGGVAGGLALFAVEWALMSYGGTPLFRLLLAAVTTAGTFFPLAWLLGLTKSLQR